MALQIEHAACATPGAALVPMLAMCLTPPARSLATSTPVRPRWAAGSCDGDLSVPDSKNCVPCHACVAWQDTHLLGSDLVVPLFQCLPEPKENSQWLFNYLSQFLEYPRMHLIWPANLKMFSS